ncbi:FG-GAP-like repeat-containing protein [Bradyrhizobium sp. BR 10289]|uniref:FG-GAP-like repeat-containing protein n=1 Tax=Bradyrhizobium sp. BR 10289 TaxID=2749993 RepID=UPI001C648A08|nr:FG-GAP-like repeat-containing protein [Bradyrhizobium sp. BR 10289]MBW7974351.1 VCBS repeat-containing protein [Bradyrhizobium sp. BR 10289]
MAIHDMQPFCAAASARPRHSIGLAWDSAHDAYDNLQRAATRDKEPDLRIPQRDGPHDRSHRGGRRPTSQPGDRRELILSGPVFVYFDHPVSDVSVNVGYFDNLSSTRIEFRDVLGNVLQSVHNTTLGVQTFSFSSAAGIASVAAIDEKFDAQGFSLDTVVFGDPVDSPAPPVVTAASGVIAAIDRSLGTVGSSSIAIGDTIGAGDPVDYLSFNAPSAGTATVTSYLDDNPSKKAVYTINVQQGLNTFQIVPGQSYASTKPYHLTIDLNLAQSASDKAVDHWISDSFAKAVGTTLDLHEFGADLLKTIEENVNGADDAVKFLGKLKAAYGYLGLALDMTARYDAVRHAADAKKELFIQTLDFFVGWDAAGVVGGGVTLVGTPLAGLVAGTLTKVVYTFALSDWVKGRLGEMYDQQIAHHEQPVAFASVPAAATPIDISAITFDADYYLNSHPDALAAVRSGAAASAYAHYLAVGADLGYKPNATSNPIPPNQIVGHQPGANAAQGYNDTVFTATAGTLAGDGLSGAEAAFANYLNGQRTDGTEFGLDSTLSTLANRVARDWVINNPKHPSSAFDPTALGKWASVLSNGKSLAATFGTLAGLTAGLNLSGVQMLAAYTSQTDAVKVYQTFLSDPLSASALLGIGQHSIGIGEYRGVWVILLNSANAAQAPVQDSNPINVPLFGGDDRDILYAGAGAGSLSGFGGADDLVGGPSNDILNGGTGNDVLSGGPGSDRFVFAAGDGNDLITDFVAGVHTDDKIDLTSFHFSLAALLNRATQAGNDTVIDLGGGDTITLQNVNKGNLNADDFVGVVNKTPSDFGGDAKSDLLFTNPVTNGVAEWQMNGTQIVANPQFTTIPTSWHYAARGDFNADGKIDLLLLNDTTHGVTIIQMDGTQVSANTQVGTINAAAGWHFQGTADFNGDGKTDLLFLNDTTHGVAMWQMNGTQIITSPQIGTINAAAGWHFQTMGDFNGDGMSDLLFLNDTTHGVAIWQMNGTQIVASPQVGSINAAAGWHFQDTGDFNGDGKTDLLFLNDITHGVAIWQMNGTQIAASPQVGSINAAAGWHFQNTGDFNGDGKTDLLFLNDTTHGVAIWQMNGTQIAASPQIGSINAVGGWRYDATGDYNGDSKTDLLFENTTTHALAVWLLDGQNILASPQIGTINAAGGWHLAV